MTRDTRPYIDDKNRGLNIKFYTLFYIIGLLLQFNRSCRNQKTPDPALLFLNSCNTYHNTAESAVL
jgi:hypothetical protein